MTRPHISYNQIVNHVECGYYHKLDKVDKLVPFTGNIYSAFGRGIHAVPEYAYTDEPVVPPPEELEIVFELQFQTELKELEENGYFESEEWKRFLISSAKFLKKKTISKDEAIDSFMIAGKHIAKWLIPELVKQFGEFKVLVIEEELRLPIPEYEDYDFLGYVDMVIETEEQIFVLDWKSCSWGWASGWDEKTRRQKKKSDKLTSYQLTLYKHFYMEKHNLQDKHKNIETVFVLLKRSPGTDKEGNLKNPVEFYKVTSGKKKIENALNLLRSVVYNVKNSLYWRNRKNCKCFKGYDPCIFRFTEHCK